MKILFVDNGGLNLDGGKYYCTLYTGTFLKELSDLGNDIVCFQNVSLGNRSEICNFNLSDNGITCVGNVRSKFKIFTYIKAYLKLFRYVNKADFVYFFYPTAFHLLPFYSKLKDIKYGMYIRGNKGIYSWLSKLMYKNAFLILSVSDLFTKEIKKIAPDTIVETKKPQLDVDEEDLYKHDYTHKPDVFNITFLARLELSKGLIELIDAVKILLSDQEVPSFVLNIYGDGKPFDYIKSYIKDNNLEDIVYLKGAVVGKDCKLNVYRAADIFVFPTYYPEGFPRVLYEAMISGTPILTTMVAGIPGLMSDGYNCLEVKERSATSIADKLKHLMLDYEKLAPVLSDNAINTVIPIIEKKRPNHACQLNSIIKTRI